jgi:hypothetical protein
MINIPDKNPDPNVPVTIKVSGTNPTNLPQLLFSKYNYFPNWDNF